MNQVYISPRKKSFLGNMSLTSQIIIFNILVYIVVMIISSVYGQERVFSYIALTPSLILAGKNLWTLLTSMFMHASFFHIFANMFSLWFIGIFLEKIIGKKRFFWVYIIAGLIGSVFYVFACMIFGGLNTPAVGASGAIFGLLGVLAVLVPFSRIYLIVGPLILILLDVVLAAVIPASLLPALDVIINVLILIMIFSLFSFNNSLRKISIPVEMPMWLLPIVAIIPLAVVGLFVQLPIGNSAHLGGLIVGLIYGFYLRKKFPNKTKRLSMMFR